MSKTALEILERLPEGWEWSISKSPAGCYHVVIRNDGLKHEPCYTSQDMKTGAAARRDLLACVLFTHDLYLQGEHPSRDRSVADD